MIALKSDHYMSPEEYLEFEHHSDIKHEYVDGEVYAMAGTGGVHNIISGNLYMSLRNNLQGSTCRTYFADMKVKLAQGKNFSIPILLLAAIKEMNPPYPMSPFRPSLLKFFPNLLKPLIAVKSFNIIAPFPVYKNIF